MRTHTLIFSSFTIRKLPCQHAQIIPGCGGKNIRATRVTNIQGAKFKQVQIQAALFSHQRREPRIFYHICLRVFSF
jgi:hypothetical protein